MRRSIAILKILERSLLIRLFQLTSLVWVIFRDLEKANGSGSQKSFSRQSSLEIELSLTK
jgi:hypothetical protein